MTTNTEDLAAGIMGMSGQPYEVMLYRATKAIDTAIAAAVQAEREANCAAMCKECAAGRKAVQGSSEVWGDRWIHWMIDEGRYIGCSASKIRARKDVTK